MLALSTSLEPVVLPALIFLAAVLYTSVGHAGASGYIAAMALFNTAPAIMKPTALVLNILVATLGSLRVRRAGLVNFRVLLPLLIVSMPFAFLGGAIQLPAHWYRLAIGVMLIIAALVFLFRPSTPVVGAEVPAAVPLAGGMLAGGSVGFLSGLTGTGGGIFLSPILVFSRWATPRQASGITLPFILFNSVAGLLGNVVALRSLPSELPIFAAAALAGALVGTNIGTAWATNAILHRLLGIVLLIAGLKFVWV